MNETINILLNTTSAPASAGADWQAAGGIISAVFMLIIFAPSIIEGLKGIVARIIIYNLSKQTKSNIISISHSSTGLFGGMITQNTLMTFQEELSKMKGKPFDLILHTPGGDVFASMMISRLLAKYPGHIRAIIPSYAMSGGTLLALSCDEIIMSPCATLGMTDPQLGAFWNAGSAKSWKRIIQVKGKKADDASIRYNLMGQQCTEMIREHLQGLQKYSNEFIDELTSGDKLHSYQFTRTDLQSRGIKTGIITRRYSRLLFMLAARQLKEVLSAKYNG